MSRLRDALAPGRALMPYLTACDPSADASLAAALGAASAGARAIEIGIPFSDPVADGPAIQEAHQRALAAGGGVSEALSLSGRLRERSTIPIVLFSYLNPVLAFGAERFMHDARSAGADGVLILDLPPEEEPGWYAFLKTSGLDPIVLDSPNTSPARRAANTSAGSGFLYAVSREGVTGTHAGASSGLSQRIAELRRATALPLAVGFGVRTHGDVAAIWSLAECAVVGSAFVDHMAQGDPGQAEARARAFVASLLSETDFLPEVQDRECAP